MKRVGLVLLLLVWPGPATAQVPVGVPVDANRVEIDGKTHPEQIPQHAVWMSAFRGFAHGGWFEGPGYDDHLVPNGLAEYLTKDETTFIFDESKKLVAYWDDCLQRAIKAREPLAEMERAGVDAHAWIVKAKELDPAIWEIELGCRWETLYTRDRVLERLSPEGQMALLAFVEKRKAGISINIAKSGLERYRRPE